jgi:hypothetical protein
VVLGGRISSFAHHSKWLPKNAKSRSFQSLPIILIAKPGFGLILILILILA